MESHLLQMRGLKLQQFFNLKHLSKSHLLQMRGLKRLTDAQKTQVEHVASFTDAWIETVFCDEESIVMGMSHLLQMRGLKLSEEQQREK